MSAAKGKRPRPASPAAQSRQLGLEIGDVIVGREVFGADRMWFEAKLQLLARTREHCIWKVWTRNRDDLRWRSEGEDACWDLHWRHWVKLEPKRPKV
jgi:hypothetical protein